MLYLDSIKKGNVRDKKISHISWKIFIIPQDHKKGAKVYVTDSGCAMFTHVYFSFISKWINFT